MSENSSRPFDGIRIVEFGQFVAVPFAAQLLGEGGAHVIKIEALEGDPTRRLSPIAPAESRTFISRNRNKHSLPLALSFDHRAIDGADAARFVNEIVGLLRDPVSLALET